MQRIALKRNATATQVAIAWILRQDGVLTIPKASTADHVRENRGALDAHLTREDLADLDREYPPPSRKVPLALL
jgi:diketogulonate reductase-like aldo/keto reductase